MELLSARASSQGVDATRKKAVETVSQQGLAIVVLPIRARHSAAGVRTAIAKLAMLARAITAQSSNPVRDALSVRRCLLALR